MCENGLNVSPSRFRLSIKWLNRAVLKLSKSNDVWQGKFPLQGKCHEVTKGFAESQICSFRNKIKNTFIEKRLERNVQASFGTFRLLLGGVNCAKHKRHVAPNSRVNLGETVQCTVS